MSDITDENFFAYKRVDRAKRNSDVSPVELLKSIVHELETGKLTCDGLVVVYQSRPTTKPWEIFAYRCRMTLDQEILALRIAEQLAVNRWIK